MQNLLLLFASYFFYGCWDPRFLILLMLSTLLDFYSAQRITGSKNYSSRKWWLWISIVINLGLLGVFKYYNFFAETFAHALSGIGFKADPVLLTIILPLGISFYTFHGLSYVIDVYNNKIRQENNIVDYAVFVSFFPLLVAGPIERATHLLPQIKRARIFNASEAIIGLRQILWGLFKKMVIADQCAVLVNDIFSNYNHYSGSTLAIGAILFSFQIYADFSGYSDIAIGSAKLFGIQLLRNFAYPYFSRSIAEFWRRWHISLSSWFRDYLYIPLGGSKVSTSRKIRNVFIIFIVSGFWHGANWTFIAWGFLNAIYILPSVILHKNRKNLDTVAENSSIPSVKEILSIGLTFCLISLSWVFFRSASIESAFEYLTVIFSLSFFTVPGVRSVWLFCLLFIFILIEWLGRRQTFAIEKFNVKITPSLRWSFYYLLIIIIALYAGKSQQFIYFQF